MISILQNNISKWNVKYESILLICAPYPGSGKSTLAEKLAQKNNAILIQIDELYKFLRLDKWFPKEVQGMNIIEFEKLLNDDQVYTRNVLTINRKESTLACIEFIKEKESDLYEDVTNHRFGENYRPLGQLIHSELPIWDEWIDYLINKYRHHNQLVIIEGGQLLNRLIDDDELLYNIPLIIIDMPKFRAYYQVMKRYQENNNSTLKNYLILLYQMFFRKHDALKDIYLRNENKFNQIKDKIEFDRIDQFNQPIDYQYDILTKELNELKRLNNWVVYRNFKNGKLPFNPITNIAAKTNDPNTWAPYNIALNTFQNHSYGGIGFVFNNIDGYVGIDLDNCIINNQIDSFAQKIITLLNSYTEYSPSKNGLHIICKANQLKNMNIGIKRNNIEVYNNDRFFTVTGDVYLERPINEKSKEIQYLINMLL